MSTRLHILSKSNLPPPQYLVMRPARFASSDRVVPGERLDFLLSEQSVIIYEEPPPPPNTYCSPARRRMPPGRWIPRRRTMYIRCRPGSSCKFRWDMRRIHCRCSVCVQENRLKKFTHYNIWIPYKISIITNHQTSYILSQR